MNLRLNVFNRNIETQFIIFDEDIDIAIQNVLDLDEPVGFNFSPTDVIWASADTDTNSTKMSCRFSLNQYQRT